MHTLWTIKSSFFFFFLLLTLRKLRRVARTTMCRSTDFPHFRPSPAGVCLDLKAFYVSFSCPGRTPDAGPDPFPDSLTLLYLPSIAGRPLVIDGSKVRPDHPAFLTLHRVVNPQARHGDVVYGSRDHVRAWPGLRFEVYLGEEKALRGSFRRDEGQEWRLECACALEREISPATADAGARWLSEVFVAAEGRVAMTERVEMVARKRSRKSSRGLYGLDEIPEEREAESESDDGSGGCCCCDGEGECGLGGREGEEEEEEGAADSEDWEVNTEGVRWAVDVGIWVACLGVGYLVSKASTRSLRRRKLLF